MSPRERLLTALSREIPDRVPYFMHFNREALRMYQEETGLERPWEMFGIQQDDEYVGFLDTKIDVNEFRKYHGELKPGSRICEWGTAFEPGSDPAFDHLVAPLAGERTLKEIEEYPLPDFMESYRHEHLDAAIQQVKSKGFASIAALEMTIFEVAWQIRGFDELMMGFLTDDPGTELLLDRITDLRIRMMTRIAGAGLDILRLGDDVGMQHAMMMSPAMWAKWLKPRLAKVIEAAKTANPSIIVSYHSDGMIMPVIEGLIEAGVDVLNPVQPECIDPAEVKAMFGDRLAFSGTIGTQTTMPFGTPDDVRRDVKDRIETVGKGGGLFIGPSHTMEPEVPWANVVAFVEAVEEYGRY